MTNLRQRRIRKQQDNRHDVEEKKTSWATFLGIGFLVVILLFVYNRQESISQPKIRKTIAVGDLHGDLSNTIKTFLMAGLIDKNNNWAAGNSIFVQTVRHHFI